MFGACRSESIDYAVMEKTADAVVIPARCRLERCRQLDFAACGLRAGRAGQCAVRRRHGEDTRDSYVYSSSRLVATVGLRDHVVVETKDAVLVAPKERAQDVKKLVRGSRRWPLRARAASRGVSPWGSYDSIDVGERFPGQAPDRSSRRGIVAADASSSRRTLGRGGRYASVTRGEETFLLEENQSTYIPVGVRHRIENPGRIPLHIIEVQSGSYFGEDDIVRFEDRYGRQGTNSLSAAKTACQCCVASRPTMFEAAFRTSSTIRWHTRSARPMQPLSNRRWSRSGATSATRARNCARADRAADRFGRRRGRHRPVRYRGVYFATFAEESDGGIMVTASHNPPDYNGMKFVREQSRPISSDTGPANMQALIEDGALPGKAASRAACERTRHQRQIPAAPAGLCRCG